MASLVSYNYISFRICKDLKKILKMCKLIWYIQHIINSVYHYGFMVFVFLKFVGHWPFVLS